MKSIWERRNVINGIRMAFFTMLIIVGLSWGSKSKSKDTLYILFEKDKPHMMFMEMKDDDHYAFWVSDYRYFGFEPKEKPKFSKSSSVKREIFNYSWLKEKSKNQSEMILKCPNIFIVEKTSPDSIKIVRVKAFEAIE